MDLRALEICSSHFETYPEETAIIDVLTGLYNNRFRGCFVTDKDKKFLGYIPERRIIFSNESLFDVINGPISALKSLYISVPTVQAETTVSSVIDFIKESITERVVVTNEHNHIIGIITPKDIALKLVDLVKMRGVNVNEFREYHEQLSQCDIIEESNKYKDLFDNSPDMIHSVDIDGKIIEVNETECQQLGYTKKEFLELSISDIYAPEVLVEVNKGFERLKKEGKALEIESMVTTKSGGNIPVELSSCSVYDKSGAFICSRTILRDISERKKHQGVLENYIGELKVSKSLLKEEIDEITKIKQKLEETNKIKNELIAMVSHDLKNPLSTIIGIAGLLQESDFDEETVKDFAQRISNQGNYALQLCHNLLQSYKIEAGSLVLHKENNDVIELLNRFVDDMSYMTKEKELNINSQFSFKNIHLLCDKDRFEQVIKNIFSNAIKFSPKKGTISLAFEINPKSQECTLKIIDQGPGLTQDEIDKLFEKSEQLKKKNLTGTGFGLAIANNIMQLHGGSIKVTSGPDTATTFALTFPHVLSYKPLEN
jgi:PAS domain S-box-containing protein